jgi:hypothetical protein
MRGMGEDLAACFPDLVSGSGRNHAPIDGVTVLAVQDVGRMAPRSNRPQGAAGLTAVSRVDKPRTGVLDGRVPSASGSPCLAHGAGIGSSPLSTMAARASGEARKRISAAAARG